MPPRSTRTGGRRWAIPGWTASGSGCSASVAPVTAELLVRQAELLVGQVAHWTPARWRGRSDGVYALVQRLADAAAEAEGRPGLVVPRLADTVLPDQIRVMVADLVAAKPAAAVLDRLAEDVRATRAAL